MAAALTTHLMAGKTPESAAGHAAADDDGDAIVEIVYSSLESKESAAFRTPQTPSERK